MAEKFQNKYRIPSARASWWDYGADAAYFITICTKGRRHYFGQVIDGAVRLSDIGEIVKNEWLKTPELRPDMNLVLDEWVIMPNHFHAIIVIGENRYNTVNNNQPVEAQCIAPLPQTKNKFGPQSKNLASIIRGFKIGVTKSARLIDPDFAWQPRYHDRIIRDQPEHGRIATYIRNNPKNWKGDRFFK